MTLPPSEYELLMDYYWRRESAVEIAVRLQISVDLVWKRLSRARRRLKRELQAAGWEED